MKFRLAATWIDLKLVQTKNPVVTQEWNVDSLSEQDIQQFVKSSKDFFTRTATIENRMLN